MSIDPATVATGLLIVLGVAAFLGLYVRWEETGKIFF